jgi:pimeloyl-ACP methyl ester carboxylesterase
MKLWRLLYSRTPPIRDASGAPKPGSIAALERVRIGGSDQTVLLRGHDASAPVLLLLHGGPGGSLMPLAHVFSSQLEEHFVVVNWDQRGAGKSYSPQIPRSSMTTEQFVQDCLELSEYLRRRFEQDRIFIVGHSWGTELGVLAVQRRPDLFRAYAAAGQVVNKARAERISLQFAIDGALRANDRATLERLQKLDPPGYGGRVKDLLFQRKCVARYGGTFHDRAVDKAMFRKYFESPEYSWRDLLSLKKGSDFSLGAMWSQRLEVDLLEAAPSLALPVFFLHGRCDRVTPTELVQTYYDRLDAPRKELIWFERSGHCPLFEEPQRFQEVIIDRLLPNTIAPAH